MLIEKIYFFKKNENKYMYAWITAHGVGRLEDSKLQRKRKLTPRGSSSSDPALTKNLIMTKLIK